MTWLKVSTESSQVHYFSGPFSLPTGKWRQAESEFMIISLHWRKVS